MVSLRRLLSPRPPPPQRIVCNNIYREDLFHFTPCFSCQTISVHRGRKEVGCRSLAPTHPLPTPALLAYCLYRLDNVELAAARRRARCLYSARLY